MVKRHYDDSELVNYVELDKETKTLKDKVILLHLDSFCLGDTICFASFIQPFVDYHKPKKVYVTTFFPHLIISPNNIVEIIGATEKTKLVIDKLIDVGYDKKNLSHTMGGMMYAVKDTMWLPQSTKPVKPPVIPKKRNVINNKVTIAPETLKGIAKWDNNGWQNVVDYLKLQKLSVYNVSYENTMNLKNVIGFHGHDDLNVAIDHIVSSRFFIGLSSGLAWLAWAYGVPVVMISGFTKEHNEFDCFRVINKNVCNGCFNMIPSVKSNCPIFLNTNRENECHKQITPEMVFDQINEVIRFTNK